MSDSERFRLDQAPVRSDRVAAAAPPAAPAPRDGAEQPAGRRRPSQRELVAASLLRCPPR
jgi:hypothetical protein